MSSESFQATQETAETPDLRAVPLWLIIFLLVLGYWGMVYFDLHSAWFNEQVYAPYRSLSELAYYQMPTDDNGPLLMKGQKLFSLTCAVCHMETGVGDPSKGCPPLVGSEWVAAPGAGRMVRIVSKGLTGPIEVKGQVYATGTMTPVGEGLPGDEKEKSEDIAAIISYVRKTFGNNASAVKPERVEAIRAEIKDHGAPFTADELKKVPDTE